MKRPPLAIAAIVMCLAFLTACTYEVSGNEPPEREYVEPEGEYTEPWEPEDPAEPDWGTVVDGANTEGSGLWSCVYAPTMNDDWHDDVLCRSGTQEDRPYLLPDDTFVEYDEIMREARNYEDYLNAVG